MSVVRWTSALLILLYLWMNLFIFVDGLDELNQFEDRDGHQFHSHLEAIDDDSQHVNLHMPYPIQSPAMDIRSFRSSIPHRQQTASTIKNTYNFVSTSSPSSASTPRIITPTTSKASAYFPPNDPFNKHGLMRLRGVGYQPTPIGITPLAADAPDLYSSAFHHLHQRDLKLIRALGANVIRLWSFGGENERSELINHLNFLNLCWKHGLFVILTFNPSQGFPPGSWSVPLEPPTTASGAESKRSEWAKVSQRFRQFVRRYQNHPAVIMWLIGNEPNLSPAANGGGNHGAASLPAYFKLLTRFSRIRDQECEQSSFNRSYIIGVNRDGADATNSNARYGSAEFAASTSSTPFSPSSSSSIRTSLYSPLESLRNTTFSCWHPLSVPLSDNGLASQEDLLNLLLPLESHWPSAVDMYSFQVYRGATFGSFFNQYQTVQRKARMHKPLLITEYGADAMDFRMDARGEDAVNQTMQACAVLSLYRELDACPPSLCVGGLVFEYVDEWWKSSQYATPSYLGCPLNQTEAAHIHAGCGWPGKMEDEFYSEAYFGLVAHKTRNAEGGEDRMQCVEPREAFFQLADVWEGVSSANNLVANVSAKRSATSLAPPSLPAIDIHQRLEEFCSEHNCCAYQDSSSWMSFLVFIGLISLFIGSYWMLALWMSRKKTAYESQLPNFNTAKSTPVSNIYSSQSQLRLLLQQQLVPIFSRAITVLHWTLYAHTSASAIAAHVDLQMEQLVDAILSQYHRRGGSGAGSLAQAFILTHEKYLAGYKSWCEFVGIKPNLNCEPGIAKSQRSSIRYRVQDLVEYLLIWSVCEQLRRVPSFVYERFHYRYEHLGSKDNTQPDPNSVESADMMTLSQRLTPSFTREAVPLTQAAIGSYQIDYDDLEDLCLSVPLHSSSKTTISTGSWKQYLSQYWSAVRTPFSYPSTISWFSFLLNFYAFLSFSILLFFLVLDIISSEVIISIGNEFSLRSFWIYFMEDTSGGEREESNKVIATSLHLSSAGLATLLKLAQIDAILILIFQPFQCVLTYTLPRLKHILLVILSLKCLQVLQMDLPVVSSIYPMFTSIAIPPINLNGLFTTEEHISNSPTILPSTGEINPSAFALLYLTLRFLILTIQTCWIIFRTRSSPHPDNTVLPGHANPYAADVRRDLEFIHLNLNANERKMFEQALFEQIEGLEGLQQHQLFNQTKSPSATSSSTTSPDAPSSIDMSGYKNPSLGGRVGRSCWYLFRLSMFWSLVFLFKLLFDTYILLPSVAGISVNSLCQTPLEHGRNIPNTWIASTVATPLKTRQELVLENVRSDETMIGGEHSLHDMFVAHVACPTLVYILWTITFIMSLASTYVSYILSVSLVGSIIPTFFDASSRWNRIFLASWTALFWLSVSLALVFGSFLSCVFTLLLFIVLNLILSSLGGIKSLKTLGSRSSSLEGIRISLLEEGDDGYQQLYEQQVKQLKSLSPTNSSASSSHPSNSKSVRQLPLLYGLQRVLQILYHPHLTLQQAHLTWQTLIRCLYEEDLISRPELETVLNIPFATKMTATSADTPIESQFLSSLIPICSSVVRERLTFFFSSLAELRRKSAANGDVTFNSSHFPFAFSQQKSHSVLIPLYNETVFYSLSELIQPNKQGGSQAAEPAITLLEFLVAKHSQEWNNFIERICEQEKDVSTYLNQLVAQQSMIDLSATGLSQVSSCVLDALLSMAPSSCMNGPLSLLVREVLLWASYRGQTLSRTIRSLLYTRRALSLLVRYEWQTSLGRANLDEQLFQSFIATKFQLIIAAQIYGARIAGRTNRTHIQQLLQLHSNSSLPISGPVEIVYNYDVRKDLEESFDLRSKVLKSLTESDTHHGTSVTSTLHDLRQPLAPYHYSTNLDPASPSSSSASTATAALKLAALQERFLRLIQQFDSVRAVSHPLHSAAVSSMANASDGLELFSPKVGALDSLEKGVGKGRDRQSSVVTPISSSNSAEELLIQCATQQCWMEVLQWLKYEVSSVARMVSAVPEARALSVTFIECINSYLTHDAILEELHSTIISSPQTHPSAILTSLQQHRTAILNLTMVKFAAKVNKSSSDSSSSSIDLNSVNTIIAVLQDLLHQILSHHQLQMNSHFNFLTRLIERHSQQEPIQVASADVPQSTIAFDHKHTRHASCPIIGLVPSSTATPISKLVKSAVSTLYLAYEQLVMYSYYSVHITSNSTGDGIQLLHALPRHHNLLLGSITNLSNVPSPQTSAKSENQLHALIFTQGEVIQTIDMNQDFTFEDGLKVPWGLTEFQPDPITDESRFTLVGATEHIYTSHVSRVGQFMALQDMSFVTIVQRVLHYTAARLHYGHPDFMLTEHVKYRGCGLSKASPEKNLSEDLFFGTDNLLRGNSSSHIEYMRYGKGREVSLTTTAIFEDKLARGASQLLKTPDLWRMGLTLDVLTSLSIYFGSILHYLYTMMFDYTITTFVWIMIFMRLSDINSEHIGVLGSVYAIPWLFHLGYLFGLPLFTQLIYQYGVFWGLLTFLNNLILGSIYYLFQLRTKATGMQSGFHGGSAKYKGTGRSFGLISDTLLTLYQQYARTHYHHAVQLLVLLFIYIVLLTDEPLNVTLLKCYAVLLACFAWLLAPIIFNPTILYSSDNSIQTSTVISAKKLELRQVWDWVHRPCAASSPSWEQWFWEERFQILQLRALRVFMGQQRGRWRQWMQHPLAVGVWELMLRVVEWSPWLFLAAALFISSLAMLPTFLIYAFLLLVVYVSPVPRSIRLAFLCTCILFYFTSIQILDSNQELMMRHRSNSPFLLSWSSLPELFSLSLSFSLVHLIACDLFLYGYVEIKVTLDLMNEYQTRINGADASSPSYSSHSPPALFTTLCHHPLFGSWQFVYRYGCPLLISLLHSGASILTHLFTRLHTRVCYDLDLQTLQTQATRRRQQANRSTAANSNALMKDGFSFKTDSSHHASSSK